MPNLCICHNLCYLYNHMFTHHGDQRTQTHNLQVASLLAVVAGMVNITGFFALLRLTTNITGHFAYFMSDLFRGELREALVFLAYILSFFVGSLGSSFFIERGIRRKKGETVYYLPVLVETALLLLAGFFGGAATSESPDLVACVLLLAMGWQNALVTRISNSMVRTTHLTGLFTDLGIELSQLFFYRHKDEQQRLRASIRLRLQILVLFFGGGIFAAFLFKSLRMHTLLVAAMLLVAGLVYDRWKQRTSAQIKN